MTHNMTTRNKKLTSNNIIDPMDICTDDIPIQRARRPSNMKQPLKFLTESQYNLYGSQQICGVRDMSMRKYYEESMKLNHHNESKYLQELYDAGCALKDFRIIKKQNMTFVVNRDFGDYECWKVMENNVVDNCHFLRELGHPKYI